MASEEFVREIADLVIARDAYKAALAEAARECKLALATLNRPVAFYAKSMKEQHEAYKEANGIAIAHLRVASSVAEALLNPKVETPDA